MSVPERISYLIQYVSDLFTKPNDRVSPPVILRGRYGCGKSWILTEVYKNLKETSHKTGVIPIFVPLQFSGMYLIEDISKLMDIETKKNFRKRNFSSSEKIDYKYIILIEGIDKIFDIEVKERGFSLPGRLKGAGASKMNYIHQSSRLRSFLIERSSSVSLLGTAIDLGFMSDPELPFYNFFNVIQIDLLTRKESVEYIQSKIRYDRAAQRVFELLNNDYREDHVSINDGVISYLNLYVGTLYEVAKQIEGGSIRSMEESFNGIYFTKLNPFMERVLRELSFNEKVVIDYLSRIETPFRVRDLYESGVRNNSRVVSSLQEKGILRSIGQGRTAQYDFSSNAMRLWLKFNYRLAF